MSTIRIAETPEEVARLAAELICEDAKHAEHLFSLCLSGGRTPQLLYRLLADPEGPYAGRIPWPKTHLFWGDERVVPADDPQSNYRMVRESMLARLSLPCGNVHRVPTELGPEAAATAYQRELETFFGALPPALYPRFSVVLLGMGADGHVASLFPDVPLDNPSSQMVRAVFPASQPTARITLLPEVINEAETILVLVTGEEKAETLRQVISSKAPVTFPAQRIHANQGKMLWLLDRAAAAKLGR